jgi:hypothetical protein
MTRLAFSSLVGVEIVRKLSQELLEYRGFIKGSYYQAQTNKRMQAGKVPELLLLCPKAANQIRS